MRFRRNEKERQLGNASKRMDPLHASWNIGHKYRTQIQVWRKYSTSSIGIHFVHYDNNILCIFRVDTSHDVWQFAVVLFVCMTGCLPWQKASSEDPRFVSYVYWLSSNGIMSPFRKPKLFKLLTSNAQRMFRKFLQPNIQTRPNVLDEVQNFIDERWLSKYMLDKSKGIQARLF